MALGQSTFSGISGAVNDLFAGFGEEAQGRLKGEGLRIQAEGTRIGAEGTRLSAAGMRIRAQGDLAEAGNYDLAAALADKNRQFTEESTAIKLMQIDREILSGMGRTTADTAGAGLASSGSSLDILRDSASQGALTKDVAQRQGLITEAGYEQQAESFRTLASAGRWAAGQQMSIADRTDMLADRTDAIAGRQDILADRTEEAAEDAATGKFISAGIKGVSALATLFI